VALAFATLPTALEFLNAFGGERVVLFPRATEYLSFVLLLVAAFGVTFEFPLILLALSLVGVLSSRQLRKGRRFAWIVILIVAAVITPTADPITQLVLSVPLALLYEGTILAARLLKR
jgi:sec-independent protein translocase protein TatC